MSHALDSLYQDIILDHSRHPRWAGLRTPYDAEVHHVNPTCGDEITLRTVVREGVIADVSYDALGCSISQAAASVLAESVIGTPVPQALALQRGFLELMHSLGRTVPDEELLGDAAAFAGVAKFPARVKCALLPWMAWQDALARSGVAIDDAVGPSGPTDAARQKESHT